MRLIGIWLSLGLLGWARDYNGQVLAAIESVTRQGPPGYFMGVRAVPAESPIGYPLALFGQPLLVPPRSSSYCSGSTYAVLIETLNQLYGRATLSPDRLEALRMQEPDGRRREDGVKAWGWWNADGYGCHYALVQYLGMGEVVSPKDAQPGDFMNLSWSKGVGHSVVFLGYSQGEQGLEVSFFSSQVATSGLGRMCVPAGRIKDLKVVRLTRPGAVFTFRPQQRVDTKVSPDYLDF